MKIIHMIMRIASRLPFTFFSFVILSVVFTVSSFGQAAQVTSTPETNTSQWELYSVLAKPINQSRNSRSKWGYGFGVGRRFGVSDVWDIHSNVHYLRFQASDRSHFILHLGPSASLLKGETASISLHARGGPAGIIGNDYAGFFASFNLGMRFTTRINRNELFMEADWAHGMAFHPGNFTYLSLSLGWAF